MSSSSLPRTAVSLRSAAAALASAALLAAGAGTAAAEVPPPPPPPADALPPLLPEPPRGDDLPPPPPAPPGDDSPKLPPESAGSESPNSPTTIERPATPVRPGRLIELSDSKSLLRGRRLSVSIRCQRSGAASLRRGRRALSRTTFTCVDFGSVVSFKLAARDAKAIRQAGRARAVIRFKLGRITKDLSLTLVGRPPRTGARIGGASARAASLESWRTGDVKCGSQWSLPQGLSANPGYLTTYNGRADYVTYRYHLYVYGQGWLRPTEWEAWTRVESYGAVMFVGHDPFGLRNPGVWVAVAIEKYWYYATNPVTGRHSESFYLTPTSDWFGSPTSGLWCYWSI